MSTIYEYVKKLSEDVSVGKFNGIENYGIGELVKGTVSDNYTLFYLSNLVGYAFRVQGFCLSVRAEATTDAKVFDKLKEIGWGTLNINNGSQYFSHHIKVDGNTQIMFILEGLIAATDYSFSDLHLFSIRSTKDDIISILET